MIVFLIILVVLIGLAFYIQKIPSNVPVDQQSTNAIENIGSWLTSQFGPRWPMVLSIILLLTVIILYLTTNCTIVVPESLYKVIALLIIAVAAMMTTSFRTEYLSQNYGTMGISNTQYYVELWTIVGLLILNLVVIYKS